jgi:non-specific serine/threonine protein kinase
MSEPRPSLEGTTLLNRYRLDAEIGHGGMGVVYRAHDLLLERAVAVKRVNDARLGTEGRAQLLREARAAAQLNHPNVVGIYDAGEADGAPFIVMELVEGQTLFERAPLPLQDVIAIARQICAALDHAHAHGVIHRDLKPENVVLTAGGTVKVLDFGLAYAAASRLTSEGAVFGTVFYLAPEQVRGEALDGRADLYALGVMLYELTTHRLPFEGDPLVVISQHLHAPALAPRHLRPDLPAALDGLITQLLSKRPEERPASAAEVRRALEALEHAGRRDTAPLPEAVAAARHNLPIQLTSFVGREREMAEVKRLLAASRLVTLTGSGGCGKTRLAVQVAAEVLDEYADGAWLVELAALADPASAPQKVASVFGVGQERGRELTDALIDHLRARHLLLVLDNCEHLVEAAAQLAETLLRACPRVTLLATSREALDIAGETSYRVPSLSTPDPRRAAPEELAPYEAVRLFVDRALAVRPDFAFSRANAPAIAQICRRLDGVPLALELAAARVRAMSVEQIAARLDDRFQLLTGGSRTALPRQRTLRALIDWSWDLLDEPERTLLRRLSVFWGGWTLEAAEAICGDQADGRRIKDESSTSDPAHSSSFIIHPSAVLALLTQLVNKSLVNADTSGDEPRYALLETIRQYAREKLVEAGEAEAARKRHLDFFLQLAEAAEPELRRGDQLAWLARLEIEHDNLRAAIKWCLHGGRLEAGQRLAGAVYRFWYLRGYWNEGRDWLARLLAADAQPTQLTEAGKRARAAALRGAGWLADEGESEEPLYEEGLALCREIGDAWGAAFALRGLGARAVNQANTAQAQARLDESLNLFRGLNDVWGEALARYNLGWLTFNQFAHAGQFSHADAEAHWDASLRLFRQTGDRWGIAVALGALGYLARFQNNYARAITLSEESVQLFRELGDKAGIATSLTRLGNLAYRRGDFRQAAMLLEESLALQREVGNQWALVFTLSFLGLVTGYRGDYARASALFEEGLARAREVEDNESYGYLLGYQGLMAHYQGDQARAAVLCEQSLAVHRELGDSVGMGYALYGLGLIARRRGEPVRAVAHLEESLALFRRVRDKRSVALVSAALGRAALAQGDQAGAAEKFRESLLMQKHLGDKHGLAEGLERMAELALAAGDADRAARLFGAAEALRNAIDAPLPPVEQAARDQHLAALRARLGESVFAAARAEGQAMTPEQAIENALATPTPSPALPPP